MKHLLDITKFLSEALTPEFKEKYRKYSEKRSQEVIGRLNKLLDNKERVYIPYNSETISETQLKVKDYLEGQGYKIMDYKLNSAVQIENSKRQIRISKLLAKNSELLKEFTLDDTRANIRSGSEFMIVLTSNYEDVAGMSYCRDWTSCVDLMGGTNRYNLQSEIQQGTIIAYLIKSDDLEIEKPLGRVAIKPYESNRDKNEVIYIVDREVYGNIPDKELFREKVVGYIRQIQSVKLSGFYFMIGGLYGGGEEFVFLRTDGSICHDCKYDEEGFDYKGYNRERYNKEGYDKYGYNEGGDIQYQEYLTSEQYDLLRVCVEGTFTIGIDGLVNVKGGVNLSSKNLIKIPINFGFVTGDFNCFRNNLTSLVGSPIKVGGNLYCSVNQLTSLVGSPQVVRGNVNCSYNNLTSLVGSPQEVGGDFYCGNNNLISLEGVPREVGWDFNCSNQKNGYRFTKEIIIKTSKIGGKIYV